MRTYPIPAIKQAGVRQLAQTITVYGIFCGLSLWSRVTYPVFGLVTLIGIALPLAWGKMTGNWIELGFTCHQTTSALRWGGAAGILTSMIGIVILPQLSIPSNLGTQLAIGLPIWIFIASPFQEFFFRGWLQTRLNSSLGKTWGLITATLCFTLWHYAAPFSHSAVPLETPVGALSTFAAGLVYAYAFQQTQNIIAPWLAHALTGLTFIVVGAMDFVQPIL